MKREEQKGKEKGKGLKEKGRGIFGGKLKKKKLKV